MAIINFATNAEGLAEFCERELDLAGARLPEEYFYQSLPLCVIDAVFSIGVRYDGVRNVVKRYCDYFRLQEFRAPGELSQREEQEPLTTFVVKMNSLGLGAFTRDIFSNGQRTSTRNGILKAEAVWRFAAALVDAGVNLLQDVPAHVDDPKLDAALRSIPGHASGISITYFFMLAGNDDLVKPDRWIGRFLARHLGYAPGSAEAQALLSGACAILRQKHPHLTPRLLDNVIWKFERRRKWHA